MKTFTLAILGLLALANAEEEYQIDQSEGRKANPEPEKAYAHPGYEPPAGKRLAKRAAYKVGDDVITKKFDEAQIDQSEAQKANPEPDKAYAHPGYEQPAYKRLAKRQAPQPYAYPNDYHVAAAYPGPAPVTKINIVERLAKRDAAIYADPDVDPRVAPVGDVLAAYADPDVITRYARDLVEEEGDARKANPEPQKAYANPGYKQPAYKRLAKRAAPVAKTNDYLCFCDLWTTSTCRQVCTIG